MLTCTFDRPCIGRSGDDTRTLRVRVTPPRGRGGRPLDVAVMMDRSSSMSGAKLEAAKQTCREIAAALRPEDRLTLGVFAGDVQVLGTGLTGSRAAAALAGPLAGLGIGYGTRMDLALEGLAAAHAQPRAGAARLALLVTDGYPFDADRRPVKDVAPLIARAQALGEAGVVVTALGLGPAEDFNAGLLHALAAAGCGQFLLSPTPGAMARELREKALEPAQHVADPAAILSITGRLPHLRLDGACRCHRRPSFAALRAEPRQARRSDGAPTWTLPLGELIGGEKNDFLLRFVIPPTRSTPFSGERPIAALTLEACGQSHTLEAALTFTREAEALDGVNAEVQKAIHEWEHCVCINRLPPDQDPERTAEVLVQLEALSQRARRPDWLAEVQQMKAALKRKGHDLARLLAHARSSSHSRCQPQKSPT